MASNKTTTSAVRIQLVVLSIISVTLSLVSGLFLLWFGLSVEVSEAPATDHGLGAEVLSAFAVTGVGALLTAFGLFAAGASIALLRLLSERDKPE